MSNNKQSSIEWLISQLENSKYWLRVLNESIQMSSAGFDIIEQAKEMHKEEIVNAVDGFPINTRHMNGEDYYNEHFNKKREMKASKLRFNLKELEILVVKVKSDNRFSTEDKKEILARWSADIDTMLMNKSLNEEQLNNVMEAKKIITQDGLL